MGGKTMTSSIAVGKMQDYKRSMSGISEGMIIRDTWEPLRSHWTVVGHDRQSEIDYQKSFPSQYNQISK